MTCPTPQASVTTAVRAVDQPPEVLFDRLEPGKLLGQQAQVLLSSSDGLGTGLRRAR